MAGLPAAAALLDYLYPLCMFLVFVAVLMFDWVTLRTNNVSEKPVRGRRTALTLTAIVSITYTGQVILNLIQAVQHKSWAIPEHRIIGTLGDMYIWGVLTAALATFDAPVWDPFVALWLLGLAFEVTMCGIAAPQIDGRTAFDVLRVVLQGIRISASLILALNIFRIRHRPKKADPEGETEPLLAGHANGTTEQNEEYGTTKTTGDGSESAEEDPDKDLKESQRKRLEAHGGWWGYVKEFKIFVPYLIPYKNRKVQLCLVLMMTNLLLERFVNVMVPRQMGIITDKLAKDYRIMPWREVLVWVVLRWGNSFASFGLIAEIARTYYHNWSSRQIKQLAFGHVMALSMDFHSNKDSGDLIKSIYQADSLNDMLETVFFQIVPIFMDVLIAFAYISHLFNGAMAMVFVMVGTMFVWTSITTTTKVRPHRRVYTEKNRAEGKTMYECVSNWPTISYFNRTGYEEGRYQKAVKEEMKAQLTYYILNSLGYAVQYLIIYGGLLTVSMMAIFQISEGRKPIGNFVTLIMYWSNMLSPLHMITYQYRRISSATVDAERLLQLLQTDPTVKNHPSAKPLKVDQGKVVFEHVKFSYDERKTTLDDLSFSVTPGQTVAFVGETGGGKSTTLKLLFRFYDVKEGSISIDGQDVRDVTLESLREELGVVPQDPSLFNNTIMENVRYARLDATNEEVIEACKAAAVHEKIMTFPDKYDSKVGERGVKLSGGELQRVAIARVILKNPKIVLLDEATSAVDSSIEAQIQAAFKKLSTGRTTFVVAHRLSTIMEADLILVIDHGKIIERGTHEELINQGKKYCELWTKQTAGKGSNNPSKAPSVFLELPEDVNPALRNDLTPTTYSEELHKAFVNADDVDGETSLSQVDGACESKQADDDGEAKCLGISKPKKRSVHKEIGDDGSQSSSGGDDQPIRMISAKPTTGTATTTNIARPHANSTGMHSIGHPSSLEVELGSRKVSTAKGLSIPGTQTSSSVSIPPEVWPIPKVTIQTPKGSSTSESSNNSQVEDAEASEANGHKSVKGRKATGYPKDMPGATDKDSSAASTTTSDEAATASSMQANATPVAPPPSPLAGSGLRKASSSVYSKDSSETGTNVATRASTYFDAVADASEPSVGDPLTKKETEEQIERHDTASLD